MSGTPSEAEIQSQWAKAVDVLETLRVTIDDTVAGAGGKFDTLLQAVEGEYLPAELARFVASTRASCSDILSPERAASVITPILFEYARILGASAAAGFGSGYRTPADVFRALYQWFHANSLSVQSRGITFDTSVTAGGSNVGNGSMSRLTVDENGYDLEACHVEKKQFRCVGDQNTGSDENAEVFEFVGTPASPDSVRRVAFGSGDAARRTLISKHAGAGRGGSLLNNSSFSTYSASGTPKFSGWTEAAGGSQLAQDTSNVYRTHPNAGTDASLKITGGGGTVTIKQTLANMRVRSIDPNTPYFLRVMVNPTVGSASGGNVVIRLGGVSKTVAISALAGGWEEIAVDFDESCWPRQFNADPFDVEIEWASSTSGYLLVDDVIFAPWDLVDGTYWCIRGSAASHTPWLLDDILTVTDTGGNPADGGVIQWWLFVAGFGHLPSAATPTFADP